MKKISIEINKPSDINLLEEDLKNYCSGLWKYEFKFQYRYLGNPQATLCIPHGVDSWRKVFVEIGGISTVKPVDTEYLTKEERESILDSFYSDILLPFQKAHEEINIITE